MALVSDDYLLEHLVLKGGNALALVHGVVQRGSLDLDFTLEADFDDEERAALRMQRALERTFADSGFVVMDFKLPPMPAHGVIQDHVTPPS